nr:hypothetical protein [Tanacetum cinerariifolium]
MTKVIKREFEKLKDLNDKDVSLTCGTLLQVFNNKFNRMSGMDDDLFIYEVANIRCDSNKDNDSEQQMSHESNDDMGYDPSDIAFTEWLESKSFNYKTMYHCTKKALWIYWRGDDEVELTDEEFSDNEDEVAEVFRIDTNIFDFETPMCKAFKEFNYLLQIDPDLLTKDIEGFKTYEESLKDYELKEQDLRNKAIMEGSISDDKLSNNGWRRWEIHEITYHDHDEIEYENETHDERQKLCEARELTVDVTGTIVVLIERVWDVNAVIRRYLSIDFVVSDSKVRFRNYTIFVDGFADAEFLQGNMIHCTAKSSVAYNFLRLKEGGIYFVKNFVVLPNKDEFQIFRHDMFMIEFNGETAAQKSLWVTLWGELGDVLVKKKTKHAGVYAMVLTGMSGKEYNNKLYLSSTSFTVFCDDDDIPCLQELRADDSRDAPSKAPLPIDCSQPRERTLENLPIWARNRQNNTVTFHCKVMIENFKTKKGGTTHPMVMKSADQASYRVLRLYSLFCGFRERLKKFSWLRFGRQERVLGCGLCFKEKFLVAFYLGLSATFWSRPNGKMIVDSIENGPYVRRMIATPGEPDLPVPVPESFHKQTDEELTKNDIKRMDADD